MTEISVENLLKPRYKVIADWPGVAGKVMVGDILVLDDLDGANVFWCAGEQFQEDKLKDYPHLFKRLEWWEDRKEEEMPKYVKSIGYPDVYKIRNWDVKNYIGFINDHEVCDLALFKPEYGYQPATESDYLSFINQNKQQ